MALLQKLADVQDRGSLSNRLRNRRFLVFEQLCQALPRPLRLIDIGGTNDFWHQRGWAGREDVTITLLNLDAEPQRFKNVVSLAGNATDLGQFEDDQFHVAFSNSVIEHLFTYENQAAMATEVRRIAEAYWVQTPNFWFPIEPHFHVPGWQWLPIRLREEIIQRRRCGHRGPHRDRLAAHEAVAEVRLLKKRELRELFPDAALSGERVGGVVKSWVAIGGFSAPQGTVGFKRMSMRELLRSTASAPILAKSQA